MAMDDHSVMSSSELQSPILVLTDILRDAHDDEGLISVPSVVINTVKSRLRSSVQLPALEIQSMVSTLDSSPSSLCSRLGIDTFVVIVAVLRASEPCLAQERGLYLLTRSLEEDRHSSDPEDAAARKAAIGEKALSNLLRYFGHTYNLATVRRWIGLLAGELLQDCEENGDLVAVGPEDTRRALGQTVIGDKSQILRVVAGTIIRGLISSGIPEGGFWPVGADARIFADFPKSQHHTSQWVVNFEEYLDNIFSQGISDETAFSLFAHGMTIENLKFSALDEPAILVTVNENLCIMVPASEAQPAVYVDVPLANITDLDIEIPKRSQRTASQEPPAAVLRLRLSEEFDHAFYLNASQHSSPEIVLFLDNAEDATDVRDWIFHARASPRVSGSQAVAVSQGLIDSLEATASAAESHDTTAKGDVGALDHKDTSPLFPENPTAVEGPTSPSREDPLNSTPHPSGHNAGSTRASLASTTIPVGVLAHQATSKRRESLSPIKRPVQPSSAPAAFVRQSDEFSEHGTTSSAQWTKGMKVIDNAPELQVNISESVDLVTRPKVDGVTSMVGIESSEKQARATATVQRITSKGGKTNHAITDTLEEGGSSQTAEARTYADADDLDHNSLYDASPRGSTKKLYTNPKQLMLDGGVDEARERRDYHKASSALGRTNGHLDDTSDVGVNVNTTPKQGRKTARLMQSSHGETIAPTESAPSPARSKLTAAKNSRCRAKTNRARAVASPNPDISNENDDLFNVPESPDQSKKTKSANERASKGRKATKPRAKPAVYSAKVALRTSTTSTAKPQPKKVKRPLEPTEPSKIDDTDWNEGLEVNVDQAEFATVRKKANFTSSKPISAVKDRKKKNNENHSSPFKVEAGNSKKKKTLNSKTVAAKHQANSVATGTIKAESSKKAKTPISKTVAAKYQSSPVALNQPESRRAAAVKANNRIQGIQDEDVDLSAEPLQPESAMDGPSSNSYADRETDLNQAKLRASEDSDLMKTSPFTEGPFQKPIHNEIHIKNGTVDHVNDAVASAGAVRSPKVLLSEACGSPEEVALLSHLNENTPRPTIEGGQLDKQVASADADSSEKENRKATTHVEDMEQPLDHYFDDALAYSDDDINHKLGSVENEIIVQEADSFDEALNEEPLADQKRRTRGSKFQNSPNGVSTKTKKSIASKLREALSGVLNTSLNIESVSESKDSLPRASAKFQPKMTEPTPDEEPKRTKPSRGTKSKKPLHTANEDREEKIFGRVGGSNEISPQYVVLKNLIRSKTPEPAETARALDAPQAALGVVKSNAEHIKSEDANIIDISSEDGEVSEYFSDGAGEDDVPFAVADKWEFFQPTPIAPVVVAAKPKHVTAKKPTATPETVAIPKTAEAHVASRTGKRKSRGEDDEARITKKLKAQLPMRITTPPKEAGTEIPREGTPTPLIDEYLHRKSTLISFSANGPRNQGIVSVRKPRVSVMASNNPERQNNHQKEALMKRKRDEYTVTAARLVETPDEKRRRHSRARNSTGTSALDMLDISQRLSSHGTRVDANGSPRPLGRNPRKSDEWAHGVLKSFQGLEDSPFAPIENAVDRTEVDRFTIKGDDLPTLSSGSLPDQDEEKIFPSIRKQLPSSPNAPSQILADFTAHRVQPGGRFVNVETESIVKPSVPQDPFTGSVRRRPSTFMERLRAQGKLAEKSRANDPNGKDPTHGVEMVPTLAADPDKTLVFAESADSSSPGLRPDTSSESSDSPNSSSDGQSNGRASEDEAARQWREALQPHQTSQLDTLYDISNHLVRHLIDQETAVGDIIESYRRGGTRLIEEMEKTHQREFEQFQAEVKELSTDLVKMYTENERKLVKNLAAMDKSPVAKLEKQWRAEQEEIEKKLDAALLACRE